MVITFLFAFFREEAPPTPKLAPIEEWIAAIRESIEVQRLANTPALMLEWIAKFEKHPSPEESCGVDYQAIYIYIADLLEVNKFKEYHFIY